MVDEPWEWDEKFTVGIPMEEGVYYFRMPTPELAQLVSAAPELRATVAKLVDWLEGAEEFRLVHGVHSDVVDAQKLLARVTYEDVSE